MKFSKMFIPTLREAPADADIVSAKLMFRSGMIRKLASGLYEWLPLGLKVLRKVETIIRQEMNVAGGQEVWLPIVLPKELWEETGRWNIYGKELGRLKDRKGSDFCLGPTHEEVITDMVRKEVRSYRQLPVMFYQFGTKFRDEIRPRFGVMRAREFLMKDGYSFHADEACAEKYYEVMYAAYQRICERCGFKYRAVEATTGAIGGSFSHEFMVLAETGEEEIVSCACGYGANTEKAMCPVPALATPAGNVPAHEDVHTPGIHTVEEVSSFMKLPVEHFIKTMIYIVDDKPVVALVRGDYEINEHKLQALFGAAAVALADEATIEKVTGAKLGFAGPVGLKDTTVTVVADHSVQGIAAAVSGANKNDHHTKNIVFGRDYTPAQVADIRVVKRGDACAKCGKLLEFSRGIEVGHTFKLGTKYSKAMNAHYLDQGGKEQLMVMGCYGIGVSRIVAATIEQSHDENGIIWPVGLAPFQVVIIPVKVENAEIMQASEKIYAELASQGVEVLMDDRDERPGIKFKDADLIGIPFRITISDKTLPQKVVELKARWEARDAQKLIALDNIVATVLERIRAGK